MTNSNGAGCVFEYCGKVPESVYATDGQASPLEEAVRNNDPIAFNNHVEAGNKVNMRLKVGDMTCIEYAAMMGYAEILASLIEKSTNRQILKKYFALEDIVDRAYLISTNKEVFFEKEALAEANRYEAALFTAIEYNNAVCVSLMMRFLGPREINKHSFLMQEGHTQLFNPMELASARGHTECLDTLRRYRESDPHSPSQSL